jgi:hypothetical protein
MFILLTIGTTNTSAQDNFSDYVERPYLKESMSRIYDLLYEELVPILSTTDTRDLPKKIRIDTQQEVSDLVERTLHSAAAFAEGSQVGFEECDFFGMSVDLRGVSEALKTIRNCADSECTSKFLGREQARLLFFSNQLDKKREDCPIQTDK